MNERQHDRCALTSTANGRIAVWETRPTGVVLRTADAATPIELPVSYPITALENGPNGGVWTGYALGGISFQSPNGLRRHFSTADGLPNSSVLSISPVPNDPGRVWVATIDGAAVVSLEGPNGPVHSMPMLVPGPVDAVRALADGGAWLAFKHLALIFFGGRKTPTLGRRAFSFAYLRMAKKWGRDS